VAVRPAASAAPIMPALAVSAPVHTATEWPRPDVLSLAMQAYRCGRRLGYIERPLLTVIDYSLPSSDHRLWVIDVANNTVLFNELVAHGENSGDALAVAFSNVNGSRQSSIGLFRTEQTYVGAHGLSLVLDGLEPGVNDQARERHIVMHGAQYVNDDVVATYGRLGRSWGCPALPAPVTPSIVDSIRNGSAVFAYYPDAEWLQSSRFLHCEEQLAKADR
jgi:hypothetical protein